MKFIFAVAVSFFGYCQAHAGSFVSSVFKMQTQQSSEAEGLVAQLKQRGVLEEIESLAGNICDGVCRDKKK